MCTLWRRGLASGLPSVPDEGAATTQVAESSGAIPRPPGEPLDVIWSLRDLVDEMPEPLKKALSRANMNQRQLNQLDVQAAISRWQRFPGDTGSYPVQVAVSTVRIKQMQRHMMKHKKDHSVMRLLVMLIHLRNRQLKYLRRSDREAYEKVIADLKIKPNKFFDPVVAIEKRSGPTTQKVRGVRRKRKRKGQKG